jgi:fructose-bisphosphate aldolase class 1
MSTQELIDIARTMVADDKGLLAMDESNGPRNTRSSATTKPSVSMRKIALSLSQFLKKQRPSLATRRRDDGKQAQPGRQ